MSITKVGTIEYKKVIKLEDGSHVRKSVNGKTQRECLDKMKAVEIQLLKEGPKRKYRRILKDELLSWLEQREMLDVSSLSETISEDDERDLEARLGVTETGYEQVEQREWMKWVFSQVTPDEKRLLELRFIHRLGQRETARLMNVSQMQVSRLERRVLARLRENSDDWRASRES